MSLYGYKKKGKQALWKKAFPEQVRHDKKVEKLYKRIQSVIVRESKKKAMTVKPIKNRLRTVSIRQAARLAEYRKVAQEFLGSHTVCASCLKPGTKTNPLHVHHVRGRIGQLLTCNKYFRALHDECHRHLHDNPAYGQAIGCLAKMGEWGKQP